SQQLRTMIEPVNTTDDTTLTWMSTVPSVATVDQEGNVTAVSEGYAIIRVKTVNGISTTCRVEVVETQEVPITGVSLDQESMTLTEGESGTLNATIIPGDTTDDRTLTWSSDAPEVAVVNDGEITPSRQAATITVTTSNGKSASCIVTVERKEIEIISVSLDHSELTMKAGRETTLNATINPADTTMSKELSWSTSNAEVATVEDGVVRAVAEGDAVISVTTVNGKRAECVVHVFSIAGCAERYDRQSRTAG
ncbi:MAG: Ig domain-containing protein, partial [Merdibacter sp.]